MTDKKIHEQLIKRCIMDYGEITDWETFNDVLNCTIFKIIQPYNSKDFIISNNEFPVFSCQIRKNLMLITTRGVYSIFDGIDYSMSFFEMNKIKSIDFESYQDKPKTQKIKLLSKDGKLLFFEVDSLDPARACITLIIEGEGIHQCPDKIEWLS